MPYSATRVSPQLCTSLLNKWNSIKSASFTTNRPRAPTWEMTWVQMTHQHANRSFWLQRLTGQHVFCRSDWHKPGIYKTKCSFSLKNWKEEGRRMQIDWCVMLWLEFTWLFEHHWSLQCKLTVLIWSSVFILPCWSESVASCCLRGTLGQNRPAERGLSSFCTVKVCAFF